MKSPGLFFALVVILAPMLFAAEPAPGADIFARTAPVLRLKIEIAREHIRSLQSEPRKDVPATVREGDRVYTNVLVHVKGAAGSFREINSGNPALTVSFAKGDSPQRFHGLRKIHLNNSVQDRSFSTEIICGEMFREAGVPTPRATNARIWLNGRDLGFYVVKEGFAKEFLGMYFENTKGYLYDGGFLTDIDTPLEKDSGDANKGQKDLDALVAAARTEPAKRWEAIQKVLDTDRFLTYWAIEAITWDWDGYPRHRNNYRVYHDPKTDKMVFFPHGMDQMFEDANGSVFSPQQGWEGLVARAIYEIPEGRKLFRERVNETFAKHYRLQVLTNRFDFLTKRNREAVAELGRKALGDYEWNVANVRERIIARWQSVKDQIESVEEAPQFEKGPIALQRWRSQVQSGEPRMQRDVQSLYIGAGSQTIASWRSSISLEGGRYRFHASAKTKGIGQMLDQQGGGVGVRISGSTRRHGLNGDKDWTKLQYEFDIPPGGGEVTLICESRATRGEAWFDVNSLKLEKLK